MGNTKHRTQISLEPWQYQALLETSRKTNKSLSSIIRKLVGEKFSKEKKYIKKDPIMGIIGKGAGDSYPAAKDHDDILYKKGIEHETDDR